MSASTSTGWRAGASAAAATEGREACLVFLSGKGAVEAGGKALGVLGGRASPFDGLPGSVYVPAGSDWRVDRRRPCRVRRLLGAGQGRQKPVRVIAPDELSVLDRGEGTNLRHVVNILPETDPTAESLLVVEVITPGGHWSSYPPHKHDRDALPDESALEETYYHRLNPPQGFAFQRVYTDDRVARRDDRGRRRRRDHGAARLSPLRRAARLRSLLPQRHGRAAPHLEVPQRPGPRMDAEADRLSGGAALTGVHKTC